MGYAAFGRLSFGLGSEKSFAKVAIGM